MYNTTFFAGTYSQITGLIQGQGTAILSGVLGYALPAVKAGVVAWIASKAILVAHHQRSGNELWGDIIRAALVLMLLQSVGNYNQYIGNIATALPNEIGNAMGGAGAGVANGAAFDTLFNANISAVVTVWQQLPRYSPSTAAMALVILLYIPLAMAAIGIGFLVYLASTVLLSLLVYTGPLFVACFAFPPSAKFGSGWVAAVVSAILTQVFSVGILMLFLGAEQATIASLAHGVPGGTAANFVAGIVTLFQCGLLLWLISMLVKQAPSIAASIAGGIYQNVSKVVDGALAVPNAAARLAAAKTGAAAAAGAKAAGNSVKAWRPSAATARSLSNSIGP